MKVFLIVLLATLTVVKSHPSVYTYPLNPVINTYVAAVQPEVVYTQRAYQEVVPVDVEVNRAVVQPINTYHHSEKTESSSYKHEKSSSSSTNSNSNGYYQNIVNDVHPVHLENYQLQNRLRGTLVAPNKLRVLTSYDVPLHSVTNGPVYATNRVVDIQPQVVEVVPNPKPVFYTNPNAINSNNYEASKYNAISSSSSVVNEPQVFVNHLGGSTVSSSSSHSSHAQESSSSHRSSSSSGGTSAPSYSLRGFYGGEVVVPVSHGGSTHHQSSSYSQSSQSRSSHSSHSSNVVNNPVEVISSRVVVPQPVYRWYS